MPPLSILVITKNVNLKIIESPYFARKCQSTEIGRAHV